MIIENTIADAIDFFHLDALSSRAVPLKIEVDLQLTLMASTLYRILARRIGQGIENEKPRTSLPKVRPQSRQILKSLNDEIVSVTLSDAPIIHIWLSANYNNFLHNLFRGS